MTLIIFLVLLEIVLLYVTVRFIVWVTRRSGIAAWFWTLMVILGAMLVVLMFWDGLPVTVASVGGVITFLLASVAGAVLG